MQVPATTTCKCSELQAAMLAAAFCHKTLFGDKVPLNFETIYIAFEPLRLALNRNFRFTKVQAWAAFRWLLEQRFLICAEKGYATICLHHVNICADLTCWLCIKLYLFKANREMCAGDFSENVCLLTGSKKWCCTHQTIGHLLS